MSGHPAGGPAALRDVDALATVIDGMRARAPHADRRLLVGIAGAPGAGKSTVGAALAAAVPGAVVLPMDGFHLPQARLVALGRRDRMGAPDTFDVAAFLALLRDLRRDEGTVRAPDFDRAIEEPVPGAIPIGPDARTVIVEGNYLLHADDGWHPVAGLLDLTVALRLADATRRERLITRHVAHGKSPAAAEAWVAGPDEANARLIAPGLDRADYSLSG